MNIRIRVHEADLYPDPRRYVASASFDGDRNPYGVKAFSRDEAFKGMSAFLKQKGYVEPYLRVDLW